LRILAIDIGGGTQDILLFDSTKVVENCVKMVMPSPTLLIAEKIKSATAAKRNILFTGVNMGGGNNRLVRNHVNAGMKVYCTPKAACTFNDDLQEVTKLGVTIVSSDEVTRLKDVEQILLQDLQLGAIRTALKAFNVEPMFDALAVAVLDHGAAPPGLSDRVFRFQHIKQVVEQNNSMEAFAYMADEVPSYLTRMKAVAESFNENIPLLLVDTGVAAALGALLDKEVPLHEDLLIINFGNFHTLAFRLYQKKIIGVFEHHTGAMNGQKIDDLLGRFRSGKLTNEEVFQDNGHGCFPVKDRISVKPFITATGPRRAIMSTSRNKPYLAAPYGDMMLTGCYGLIYAFAVKNESWHAEILKALNS
jgi:uncharacterized protein (DUF1786 family)